MATPPTGAPLAASRRQSGATASSKTTGAGGVGGGGARTSTSSSSGFELTFVETDGATYGTGTTASGARTRRHSCETNGLSHTSTGTVVDTRDVDSRLTYPRCGSVSVVATGPSKRWLESKIFSHASSVVVFPRVRVVTIAFRVKERYTLSTHAGGWKSNVSHRGGGGLGGVGGGGGFGGDGGGLGGDSGGLGGGHVYVMLSACVPGG